MNECGRAFAVAAAAARDSRHTILLGKRGKNEKKLDTIEMRKSPANGERKAKKGKKRWKVIYILPDITFFGFCCLAFAVRETNLPGTSAQQCVCMADAAQSVKRNRRCVLLAKQSSSHNKKIAIVSRTETVRVSWVSRTETLRVSWGLGGGSRSK